jgi:hypothetical protein
VTLVLIPTQVADEHAVAVSLALEHRGHHAIRWYGSDFPTRQAATFHFRKGEPFEWTLTASDLEVRDSQIDRVWWRRPNPPFLPEGSLHPQDAWFATRELRSVFESLWLTLGPQVEWVNSPRGARTANSKVVQLRLAPQAGFEIPDTLMSNDPERIRAFLREHEHCGAVYKTFLPVGYREGEKRLSGNTAAICVDQLTSDATLRLMPGIFQERISKAYELRVTFMGHHHVALQIRSQEHATTRLDWRSAPLGETPTSLYTLPPAVEKSCLALMRLLGIVFGCFDIIVTPDGRYVFIEVNEAGQFLFVEDLHPQARLLDAFTEFLLRPSPDFRPAFEATGLAFRELKETQPFLRMLRDEARSHSDRTPGWLKGG